MPAERTAQVPLSAVVGHAAGRRLRPAAGAAWAALVGLTALIHLCGMYFARELHAHFAAQLGLWLLAGGVWLLALWALARATPLPPGSRGERRALLWLWAIALLLRAPALALPVGHSDDVYRYLWDGAVQQAGHSPYAGPPDAAEYAPVRAAHPELPARLNHRELPTIYPPVAQLFFRAHAALSAAAPAVAVHVVRRPGEKNPPEQSAAGGGAVVSAAGEGTGESPREPLSPALLSAVRRWKALVVAADLLVLALLIGLCRGEGRDGRWAAVWGAAPLSAVELAYNGHLESLGLLPLLLALRIWQRAGWALPGSGRSGRSGRLPSGERAGDAKSSGGAGEGGRRPSGERSGACASSDAAADDGRRTLAGAQRRGGRDLIMAGAIGALVALAMLVKPIAGAVLPAARGRSRRVLLALIGGGVLAAALAALPYGGRGVVPPSLGEYGRRWRSNDGAYAILQAGAEAVVRVVYRPPYYLPWRSPRLAHLVTGRDRDTVWPDELAAALARAGVLLALAALAARGLRWRLTPPRLGLLLLLGYQLLTPVLHPWYELWPLALAALWPRLLPPVVVMAALSPLAYLPLPDYLAGRGFHEAVWPRLVQHGAGWLALLFAWRRLPGPAGAQEPIDALPRRDTLPPQTP